MKKAPPVAAIVKYNPCSQLARLGQPCPLFESQQGCGAISVLGACKHPGERDWLDEVILGNIKSFYPYRIRLFERPGSTLVLFHRGIEKIIGEATIVRSSTHKKRHDYFFEQFSLYSNPVEPTELRSVKALSSKKAICGRWRVVYISKDVLFQIRKLGGFDHKQKIDIHRDLAQLEKLLLDAKQTYSGWLKEQQKDTPQQVASGWQNQLEELSVSPRIINAAIKTVEKSQQIKPLSYPYIKPLLAAAIFLRAREDGIFFSKKKLTKALDVSIKKFNSAIFSLMSTLEKDTPTYDLIQLIERGSKQLHLKKETITYAKKISSRTTIAELLGGCTASSKAAALTAIAIDNVGEHRNQKEISEVFQISEVTLRNCLKKIGHVALAFDK